MDEEESALVAGLAGDCCSYGSESGPRRGTHKNFKRTGDPVQSYKYCGKSTSIALYVGSGFSDLDHENAWFTHALPGAAVFTAGTGIKTFIKPDGTAAVETADTFISYFRFSPGLSPAEMKILGAEPASRTCTAD